MPLWLISGALKALGWGKSLFAWLASLKPSTLAIIALATVAGVQTLRLSHRTDQRDKAIAGLTVAKQGIENLRQASLKALADAKANKARVETQYVRIKDESQTVLSARLRSELDRVRSAATHSSSADATGVSGASGAPSDPFGRDAETVLHDAEICIANTVKVEGWQEFYAKTLAVPRTPETHQ